MTAPLPRVVAGHLFHRAFLQPHACTQAWGFFIPTYTTYCSLYGATLLRTLEIITAHLWVAFGGFRPLTCRIKWFGHKWLDDNVAASIAHRHLVKFCALCKTVAHEG
uniref:Uncharacterized protein n=1 Tax=mine drainage metagenome TaxID=410659 RepID=E6PV00_9ZZZZ